MNLRSSSLFIVTAAALTGCTFDEGITIENLHGKVIIPQEAATRTIHHEDGSDETVIDPRLIGPVYLGLYPSVVEGIQSYPAPAEGPVFQAGLPGDTYPYGGTSLGEMKFPCLQSLQCKLVSGRFVDFDAMVSWFNDTLEQPIIDEKAQQVENGDYIADQCYELLHYTEPAEIGLTATADKNDDGVIDTKDLEFVDDGNGNFVADFTIYQQEYFENDETGEGFSLWGWMDAPSEVNSKFSTCDSTHGFEEMTYNRDFYSGRPYTDLLNHPSVYIAGGDWVASQPYVFKSADDTDIEITLDFPVQGD